MTYHIVTEGPGEVALIRELLKPEFDPEQQPIRIVSGGGWSGADSLARTILAVRNEPVVLIVDSDTNDPAQIQERRQFLEASLGQVGPRLLWRILLVVPEIEAILFQDKQTLEELVGKVVSDEQFLRGQYEPRKILKELTADPSRSKEFLAKRLPQTDLSALRKLPLVRELKEFLMREAQRAVA